MSFTYIGVQPGRSVTVYESETLVYLFKSDDSTDTTLELLQNRDCPRVWSKHPDYRSLFLKKDGLSVEQGSGSEWFKWSVTAVYSVLTPEEKEQEENGELPDPVQDTEFSEDSGPTGIDWDPKFSMTFEDYPKPMTIAFDFDPEMPESGLEENLAAGITRKIPIVASNLEPYDPPPEVFHQGMTIRVARNLDLVEGQKIFEKALELKNTCNQDLFVVHMAPWTLDGRQAGMTFEVAELTARLKVAIGDVQKYEWSAVEGTTRYFAQLELQWIVDPETWSTNVLDVGTYYLEPEDPIGLKQRMITGEFKMPDDTKQLPFKDAEGNRVQGLLNGSGGKIGTGFSVGDATFNEYFGYEVSDQHGQLFTLIMDSLHVGL